MFTITYKKTGKSINLSNKTVWLLLDHNQLEELGWGKADLWENE